MSPAFLDTDFAPLDSERTAQQVRVLEALKQGPRTTLELRQMGVANCAARVMELRRQGLDILTARAGRFACYVLRGGAT